MAKGTAPLFTSAPRIKIKINGVDIAYGVGLNIGVNIAQQPVNVIGKFGPISIEPTLYNPVTGTFQILRLLTQEQVSERIAAANALNQLSKFNQQPSQAAVSENGNENTTTAIPGSSAFDSNNPLSQQELHRHMSPRSVLLSRAFDIDLYMKVPNVANPAVANLLADEGTDLQNITSDTNSDLFVEVPWMRIQNVRVSSRNTNITMGQIVNEPVSFQGLLLSPIVEEQQLFDLDAGQTDQP